MSGEQTTYLENARVTVNAEGVLDPLGDRIMPLVSCRVPVDAFYVWRPHFGGVEFDGDGNPVLTNPITTTATNLEGIPTGTHYPAGTLLSTIIHQLLTPLQTPVYILPSLVISAPFTSSEVGTIAPLTVTPFWDQNDAGPVSNYAVTVNGTTEWTNATPAARTLSPFQFTDTPQLIRGHVWHAAGQPKYDSEGNLVPGTIAANNNLLSNTISVTGFRKAFFRAFTSAVTPLEDSQEIRQSLTETIDDIATVRSITIPVATNTRDIIFAFPVSVDPTGKAGATFPNSITNQIGAFQRRVVDVAGANNFSPVPYYVYHLRSVAPVGQAGTVQITIPQ